jgi:putative OPT family oligopeptide transporter
VESSPRSEFTLRAALAGSALGALLAAGNVYASLKIGYLDGGSITASVLAFALLASRKRNDTNAYSVQENNLSQSIASSAAVMAATTGLVTNIAALSLSGRQYAPWWVGIWGVLLGVLGVGIACLLRPRLLEVERLPFPTGRATAEVIDALHAARSALRGRVTVLLAGFVVAAAVTWFRDAWHVLPQALFLPGSAPALVTASVALGVSLSPMMLASGSLIGPRAGTSMLIGSIGAWGVLAPALLARHWVAGADYPSLLAFLVWPGVALLLASALTSLAGSFRGIVRGLRDLRFVRGERSRFWLIVSLCSVLAIVLVAWRVFQVKPVMAALALCFALIFAAVSARAAGETDIAPAGTGGTIAQILFGAPSLATSLMTGGIVGGIAGQTAQSMWAFKAGQAFRADERKQAYAQLLGVAVGAVVVVPIYDVVLRAYGLGTSTLPAPGALSWKATAEAVQLGRSALPEHAASAALLAFALGVILSLLGGTRAARFAPSPVALGIACLIPASLSGAVFVGAMLLVLARALRRRWADDYAPSLAAGAIAGEALMGIAIAALLVSGLLKP